ncbi:hypothetical protein AGMMS5026_10870 [Endomicrobiia bacterium]|uniref:hypothetical protein n=1 Tax=Endomicrobium trichonymphae TaxID=1408204 RepID=UPI000BAA6750|nr:hypothetical protein [Candidatus Endomicrobium trichonymphae]GHT10797.1 hypothetical protein AGMMS49571_00030 [Endomicrobiia bacterium]GHT20781.1 hypothetical protein AGMMS49929_08310 [Endomicrobiia bacterium]GHT25963.1 hypothetical protein AGMMS49995_01410 [Endomicrobiia bacterium]GHT32623.1 hypothetical protein AGMMS5026_10870 [Endomicrobiia bacterium]
MKKLISIFTIFAFISMFLTGCSKTGLVALMSAGVISGLCYKQTVQAKECVCRAENASRLVNQENIYLKQTVEKLKHKLTKA